MEFKVAILTPTTGTCYMAYAQSLARMVMYFAQARIYDDCEQQQLFPPLSIEGSGISANREDLVHQILTKSDATHILFIDEDMGFAPDTLHMLASRRVPYVACNYRMRVPGGDFTALALDTKSRVQTTEEKNGLEEAYYSGFGFALIAREVFEAVPRPRFLIGYNMDNNHYSTEDMPFCKAAREKGYKVLIDHAASKKIWHVGHFNYNWK